MLKNWLTPLVNREYTLLLFTTFIFHRFYFGIESAVTDLLSYYEGMWAVYVYGAIILLVGLLRAPDDWNALVTLLVFTGTALISVAYTALFWMRPSTPSWPELLAQCYYVLQAVLSLVLLILLLTQGKTSRCYVSPRLRGAVPGLLRTSLILAYAVGMTLFLHRGLGVAPNAVTAQVNLWGVLLLEIGARLASWRPREE